jgi:AraC family transcriptional regulator of adaptative response / DNA-3-methyladenine glycosylase II
MELLDAQSCYRALKAHDSRFDGRFFVGVTSTGIYCRPICTVKPPKRENCRFFSTAARAEANGFRPCLRCRPELAPGNSILESSGRLARAAAALIENGFLEETRLPTLAADLGVTDRHLRRIFHAEFGVTPLEYAQTQRLLAAKRLLTDTSLPVTEVAFASGFASVRRFNVLFKERYRLRPTDIRKRHTASDPPEVLQFTLAYRPPYDWSSVLSFLSARAVAGVEHVVEHRYIRSVAVIGKQASHRGWVEVSHVPARSVLSVQMSASLCRAIPVVLARLKRLFDLDCDPVQIETVLGATIRVTPGLRVPGAFDPFEMAIRGILGQQVSVKSATTIAGRIAARFGEAIDTPYDAVSHAFPTSAALAEVSPAALKKLGLTSARAATIIALARAVETQKIRLDASAAVEQVIVALQELPGIGEWTAQYIAMRALSWPDAFPHTDLGVKKALGESNAKKVLILAEQWKPWRAYATINLWQSLGRKKRA